MQMKTPTSLLSCNWQKFEVKTFVSVLLPINQTTFALDQISLQLYNFQILFFNFLNQLKDKIIEIIFLNWT